MDLWLFIITTHVGSFPGGTVVKNLPANAGDIRDAGLISGSGRFPGEWNGNPLQYSYLDDPMAKGAWWVTKNRICLSTWGYRHTHDWVSFLLSPSCFIFSEAISNCPPLFLYMTSLVAQTIKCLPTMWETQVQSLGWEDPLEKAIAPHSSTLSWKIPWTEEPGRSLGVAKSRPWLSD